MSCLVQREPSSLSRAHGAFSALSSSFLPASICSSLLAARRRHVASESVWLVWDWVKSPLRSLCVTAPLSLPHPGSSRPPTRHPANSESVGAETKRGDKGAARTGSGKSPRVCGACLARTLATATEGNTAARRGGPHGTESRPQQAALPCVGRSAPAPADACLQP